MTIVAPFDKSIPIQTSGTSKRDAEAAAPSYGKTAANVQKLGTQDWYRLCNNSCPMRSSGPPINNHDEPCKTRIFYTLIERSKN